MKLYTPEISWHQKEPIFSVDICAESLKLASCGADFTIKIWKIKVQEEDNGNIGLEFLANLDRHSKSVNVVRFSPNGKFLASAGDDGAIILWKLNENTNKHAHDIFGGEDIENKESWLVYKMLRGHIEDIYDLAWSPDSTQLISGSVDNSAIIWDALKGQNQKILTDHKHYIQGVSWDPRGHYVATHSSDRSCRLYTTSNYRCIHNIHKNTMSYLKDGQVIKSKFSRMFMDETMQSFFRRCTFSPDGSFLFLPAGLCDGNDDKSRKTTYVFARGHYNRPLKHLPGAKKATVAVKCSPIIYELIDDKENNMMKENNEYFKLPYRMIYAVASLDAVTFYDTQHDYPIAHCANMHYASLTDITWSSDGNLVVVSSTDGYCSFVKFDEGELGTPITFDPIEYQVTQAKIREATRKEKKKEMKRSDVEKNEAKLQEENQKKKNIVTPARSDEVKEKSVRSADRNQLTIEKLFITPVRKRKRPGSSPVLSNSNKKSSIVGSQGSPSAINITNDVFQSSPMLSPLTSKPKPAKRVQVITLSSATDFSPSLTSLKSQQSSLMEVQLTSPKLSPGSNTDLKSPPKSLKRVNVTTLSTTPSVTLLSPPKPPKRVSVTTISTFSSTPPNQREVNSLQQEETFCGNSGEQLAKISQDMKPVSVMLRDPHTKDVPVVSAASNLPTIVSSNTNFFQVKKPKRVQVTTLSIDAPNTLAETETTTKTEAVFNKSITSSNSNMAVKKPTNSTDLPNEVTSPKPTVKKADVEMIVIDDE